MVIIELGASPLRTAAKILAGWPEPEAVCPHRVWCFMNRLYNTHHLHRVRHDGEEKQESVSAFFWQLLICLTLLILCCWVANDVGLPRWLSGKEPACQCRRCRRCGFDPWIRKIPWRRKWQPTPAFLLGESHGQRNLAGSSPWGCESDTTEWLTHTANDASTERLRRTISFVCDCGSGSQTGPCGGGWSQLWVVLAGG